MEGTSQPLDGRIRVVVASTVLLSFISLWRAAAIVLSDLGSTAGIVEQAIGKSAPWFVLGVMLFSYAVRALYIESSAMFVRAGVYRVVKEAMGSVAFTVAFFAMFMVSERVATKRRLSGQLLLDRFQLETGREISTEALGCRPGGVLVPVRDYNTLSHLDWVLIHPESSSLSQRIETWWSSRSACCSRGEARPDWTMTRCSRTTSRRCSLG